MTYLTICLYCSMSDLRKKFLYQLLLSVSQLLFPLITYPYLARTLGADGIGRVSYIEFVTGLVIAVFSIGIPYYGAREIAKARDDRAKLSKLTGELITMHVIASIAGIVIFAAIILANHNYQDEKQLVLLGSLYILLQVFTIEWYLQGTEAFVFVSVRGIVIRLLGVIALFVFVKSQADYVIYYLIIVVTQLAVSLTAIYKAMKEGHVSFRQLQFKQHRRSLFYFFLTSSFISIYVFFDTIILGYLTNEDHVGYYTFGLRIIRLPLLLLLTMSTVLYPRISYLHSTGAGDSVTALSRFSIQFIITITIPVCVCFFLLAPEIVTVLGGKEFEPTIAVIRLLSPLPLFISFTNFFALQVLAPEHKEKQIAIAVCIACITSLSFNFLLIPSLKEQGAAIAALITEGVVCFIALAFSFSKTKNYFSAVNMLIVLVLSALAIPVTMMIRSYFSEPLYILILSLTIFGILYILLQRFIFRNEVISAMINFALKPFSANRNTARHAERV